MSDVTKQLRKTVAGYELYAAMAEYDSEGNKIVDTYARKSSTLAGYGIRDAKIAGTTVLLGSNTAETIPPRSESQKEGDLLAVDAQRAVIWTDDESEFNFVIPDSDGSNTVTIGDRVYNTVTIGTQTWLAENLDFKWNGLLINGESTWSGETVAWYYNNDEATYGYTGNKYGLLYTWYALNYLNTNRDTLLPPGWRVPTKTDYDKLFETLDFDITTQSNQSMPFRSVDGWTDGAGTNAYGLNIYPAGWKNMSNFAAVGNGAYLGTIESYTSQSAYRAWMLRIGGPYTGQANSIHYDNYQKAVMGVSVRLVKDMEVIPKLRKTIAGDPIYAKAAEYDSAGYKLSDKFQGALDITAGDGIHVSKVGDALNIAHQIPVVSLTAELVSGTDYAVTVALNKYTMITVPQGAGKLTVIVPEAPAGVLQEAAFQFDVGVGEDFDFDVMTGNTQLKRIAPLSLTPGNSYQGTVVGGLCTLGEFEPVGE